MNSADPFETFCAAVCAKVRWPFARWDITQELTGHLQDHAASLEEKGLSPEEAQSQAVAAMGDPAELGRALNRVHSPLWGLTFAVLRLLILCLAFSIFWDGFLRLDYTYLLSCFYESSAERLERDLESGFVEPVACIPLDQRRQLDSLSIHYARAHLVLQASTAGDPEPVYWLYLEGNFWQRDPFHQSAGPFTSTLQSVPPPTVFSDDLGNQYDSPFTYILPGVDPRASEVYLDYDLFGRHYRLTIPLDWVDAP